MKARWWHVGAMSAGLIALTAATACGGSSTTAPAATPSAMQTLARTPTPTVVSASSGVFDGWQIYIITTYGCECLFPAAGLIDVSAFPPLAAHSDLLEARVSHPSFTRPIEMPMIHEPLSHLNCEPIDTPPPVEQAIHGIYRVPTEEELPRGPGTYHLELLVRDTSGRQFWAEVAPTKVCGAVS